MGDLNTPGSPFTSQAPVGPEQLTAADQQIWLDKSTWNASMRCKPNYERFMAHSHYAGLTIANQSEEEATGGQTNPSQRALRMVAAAFGASSVTDALDNEYIWTPPGGNLHSPTGRTIWVLTPRHKYLFEGWLDFLAALGDRVTFSFWWCVEGDGEDMDAVLINRTGYPDWVVLDAGQIALALADPSVMADIRKQLAPMQ